MVTSISPSKRIRSNQVPPGSGAASTLATRVPVHRARRGRSLCGVGGDDERAGQETRLRHVDTREATPRTPKLRLCPAITPR